MDVRVTPASVITDAALQLARNRCTQCQLTRAAWAARPPSLLAEGAELGGVSSPAGVGCSASRRQPLLPATGWPGRVTALDAVLAGGLPPRAETTLVGGSIKWK